MKFLNHYSWNANKHLRSLRYSPRSKPGKYSNYAKYYSSVVWDIFSILIYMAVCTDHRKCRNQYPALLQNFHTEVLQSLSLKWCSEFKVLSWHLAS